MDWKRFRLAYADVIAPFMLLTGLFGVVPPDSWETGSAAAWAIVFLVVAGIACGGLFVANVRKPLDVGALRRLGVEPRYVDPLGMWWAWVLAVTYVIGTAAFSYWVLSLRSPATAFSEPLSPTDAWYFAITTFTTTGYGDIYATSEATRLAVSAQQIAGFLLVAVGLASALGRTNRKSVPPK